TNVFSFGGWFKVTDFSDYRMLISKMSEEAPYTGWDAYVNQTTGLVTAQLINNYGPNSLSVTTTSAITAGTWNHIYVTYDGSSAAGGIKIYVNGTLQGQTIITNTLTSSILNNEPVLIGQRNASANYDLLGQAAHVAVYASELNAAQVDQLRLYPTSITANLKAYLPLGVSGTETDFSTYANNGTPTNTTVSATTAPVTILNTGAKALTLTARTGSNQGSGAGTDITGAVESLTVSSAGTASLPAVTTRDGGISVTASAITLNGDLLTNSIATAGPVLLTGAVTLGTDLTINTDAATTDANMTLSGPI